MNKIPLQKRSETPRHHIVYHYNKNKSIKSAPPKLTPKNLVSKNIQRPTPVPRQSPRPLTKSKFIKSNVKPVSVKSALMPKISRGTKVTFDSGLTKIKSIRGVGLNKILVIFAPGPSILEAEIGKLIGISNIDTMTINKPDLRAWPSDYWMFCDRTQYSRNKEIYHKYTNTIINTESIKEPHPKQIKIKNLSGNGFSTDMTKGFYIGRSSTFSAMQVAAWMGYEKIFIFGLDMCKVGNKLHSYGINPDVPEKIREQRFKQESMFYDFASKIMSEDLRKKFYICSSYNPWPFVNKFNRLNQKEAVEFILNEHKRICGKSKKDS